LFNEKDLEKKIIHQLRWINVKMADEL